MTPAELLGPPRPLRAWIEALGTFPGDGWLYVREGEPDLSLDTLCWPELASGTDLSDDECDEFEEWLEEQGFVDFISEEQLQQVVANLRMQRPAFSEEELLRAILHYREHDAFLAPDG